MDLSNLGSSEFETVGCGSHTGVGYVYGWRCAKVKLAGAKLVLIFDRQGKAIRYEAERS